MHKLIRSILSLLTITLPGVAAQAEGTAPRLVVGIHIDQLKTDYLDWFKDGFTEDGLKRMLEKGIVYRTVDYGFPRRDEASASASLACGTTPSRHGIVSNTWYDRATATVVSSVYDPNWMGNYTLSTTSPRYLEASTLGDELKKATKQAGKVFSVGVSAEAAILSAGHEADGVYWMDDESGKWCTSTYYNYMPMWLQQINDQRSMSGLIDQTSWTPLKPLDFYTLLPYESTPTLFEYWLGKYGKDKFKAFKETPMVNEEVCRVGLKVLEQEQLGLDDNPDYLVINFKASGHLDKDRPISTVEMQDIYLRLDAEIGRIIEAVDSQVGLDRVMIYVVGTGTPIEPAVELSGNRSYHGNFYTDRCISLLNLYLMAIYGEERWISTWHNQQIYLNRELIEKRDLDLDNFSQKAAAFLGEFSGVQRVISNRQLTSGTYDNTLISYRNGINSAHSGDFFLEIQPGWNIRHNSALPDYQVRYEAMPTSLLVLGNTLKPTTVTTPVSVGDIATTLSKVFRIRPPNACEGNVLWELLP